VEPFVNSIDEHAENGAIMFQLGEHLPMAGLLMSCIHPTDVPLPKRHARVTLCTRALWALFVRTDTYNRGATWLVPRPPIKGLQVHPWRTWLDLPTVSSLRNLRGDSDPVISFQAACTSAAVACAGISDFCCKVKAGKFQLHGFEGLGILDVAHAIWGRVDVVGRSGLGLHELQDHICELRITANLLLLGEEVMAGRLRVIGSAYRYRYDSDTKVMTITKDGHDGPTQRHPVDRLHAEGCLLVLNHFLRSIVSHPFPPSVAHVELARETLNFVVNATFSSSASGPFYGWAANGTTTQAQCEFTALFRQVLHIVDPSLVLNVDMVQDNNDAGSPSNRTPFGLRTLAALTMPSPEIPSSLVSQDFVGMLMLIAVSIDDPECKRECDAWMNAWHNRA